MKKLYVRDFETRSVIKEIPISNTSARHVERVMMGLLRNMDTDRFFIDDSEMEEADV